MRASVAVSLVAIAVAFAVPSAAQQGADPKQKYNDGMKAYAARNYEEAANDFEAAAAMRSSAIAYFGAAQAWEKASKPVRAADAYSRALTLGGLQAEAEATTKERLGMLEGLLGMVEVIAPAGYRVQLDSDTEMSAPALLHGTPGAHTLTIVPPNGTGATTEQRPVTLELGKTGKVNIQPPAPPSTESSKAAPPQPATSAAPPPPAASPEPSPGAGSAPAQSGSAVEGFNLRQALGFTAIGIGGAGLLAGALLGLEAQSARDAYNAGPTRPAYDHASSLQTWTNVAFISGGVLAAGGVALVLWPRAHDGAEGAAPAEGSPPATAPRPSDDVPPAEKAGEVRIVPGLGWVTVRGIF